MKYILGGGITALIYAFYNPGYKILHHQIGGQMASPFDLGPRFLHKTPATEKFLKDLCIKAEVKTIKVGYLFKDKVLEIPPENFREDYFKKSRGEPDLKNFNETVMNQNKSSFEAFDINFRDIIGKLLVKVNDRIVLDKPLAIDQRKKEIVCEKGVYEYYHIVNTLPLPKFLTMIGCKPQGYKTESITFILLKEAISAGPMKGFDFVYCAEPHLPWHRVSQTSKGMVLEIQGEHNEVTLPEGWTVNKSFILKDAQIIAGTPAENSTEFDHIGRYACWDRSWKVDKVVESVLFWKEIAGD